jgi:hypothetical protein
MEFFLPQFKWFLLFIFMMMLMFPFLQSLIPSLAPLTLVVLAAVLLFFTVRNHIQLFSGEYDIMEWSSSAAQHAPTILVGAVIVFAIGYVLLLFGGGGAPALSMPSLERRTPTPPPNTATNVLTRTIGNGLTAIQRGVEENIAGRNLLSLSPSLKENAVTANLKRALESRLGRAV